MRKVILTESQAKLLLEEIDKNDTSQKLIFCEPSDIEFNVMNETVGGSNVCKLIPVIDGKEINDDYVDLIADGIEIDGEVYYQLFIRVDESLRRLGIAYKLYVAFILQGYPVCSLDKVSTFEIKKMWAKLANEPNIDVEDLFDEKGNKIGLSASVQ